MDRFVSPCEPPEGLDREIMIILAEECAEVIQRVSKALRFGVDEIQPGQPYTNAQRLGCEIGQLTYMVDLCVARGLICQTEILNGAAEKGRKLQVYVQSEGL